jgi:hypothetical protein
MRITLTEKDAERIGCPRVVEFDDGRIMTREAIAIQRSTGYTLEGLGRGLSGLPVKDRDGNIQYVTGEDGNEIVDEFGHRKVLREVDIEALLVAAWIAVRRAGVQVPWDDFDLDLLGTQFGDDEVVDEGKAPPSETTTSPT